MTIPSEFTITTAEQSRQLDAAAMDELGIDGFTLMEVAGLSAAGGILQTVEPGSRGVFLCGKGNNGGDALVVARYLSQHQMACTIVFISGNEQLSSDAEKNYHLLQTIAKQDSDVQLKFCGTWDDFDQDSEPDFIIDGMLGTGLDSNLRGDYTDAVAWSNEAPCPVFSMDIPTGLHGDSGDIMGDAVRAAQTYAFGSLKQGFYLAKGPECTGVINFCELPFPHYLKQAFSTFLIDCSWLPAYQPKPMKHKYKSVVYVIAGSEGLTGAAMMTAKSAWKTGAGAVILVCPRGVLPIFESSLPQIIKKPVGQHDDRFFKTEHLQEVGHIIHQKNGPVLLGPGLGRKETTAAFAADLLAQNERDFVIDADGLWALSQQDDWEKPDSASWILTPHPGELSRLFNMNIDEDIERLQDVKKQAAEKDITILSKGYPVILGTSDGNSYLTNYDTRLFSRAGCGDVLAGHIAALNALGCSPAESCIRSLLSGKEKALKVISKRAVAVEPMDLL